MVHGREIGGFAWSTCWSMWTSGSGGTASPDMSAHERAARARFRHSDARARQGRKHAGPLNPAAPAPAALVHAATNFDEILHRA
eukprot:5963560-Pyramimonas_sp.AAC.1